MAVPSTMKLSMNVQTGDVQAEAAALREEVEGCDSGRSSWTGRWCAAPTASTNWNRKCARSTKLPASLSWLITAPLRILKPLLRILLRR